MGELPGACFTNTLIRFQARPLVNNRFCLLLFVRRVDELFAYADVLEKRVNEARALADRLEPNILAKAFRGELSEQIPEEAAEWERKLAEIEAQSAVLQKKAGVGRGLAGVSSIAAPPELGPGAWPCIRRTLCPSRSRNRGRTG